MMKTTLYILLLLLPFRIFAQQKLTGTVTDGQGKPLDAATVTLSRNGQVLSSQLADQGKFTLTGLKPAEYQLSVILMGYKPMLRKFTVPKDSLKLTMESDSKQLKEVTVTSQKPTVERKVDRVVFNVENSIVASGGNAWEALSRAPGVQTTQDGNVKAGNKGVTVYLDDKPIRLSGDDLAAYLQSLPANNISKIEVMSNPSSKYEAQGGAVINIVSKKSKADGFNATLNTSYSRAELNRYTGGGLFNYRKDKLNIFGSYGYSNRDVERKFTGYTIYQTPDNYSDWTMGRTSFSKRITSNYTAGADYNLTGNQVIGILVTGNNNTTSGTSSSLTNINNNYRSVPDSLLNTGTTNHSHNNQYSFNLNYKAKLDTTGKSLNFDLDYVPYRRDNVQNVNSYSYLPDGNMASAPYLITNPSTQNINIWSGKIDYTDKVWKSWSLESGLKYTGISSENQLDYFDNGTGTPVYDPSKSDHFQYTENTAAAYTSISRELGKWSLKGGLRAEYTYTKGYSVALDSLNKNNYLRFFPTLFVTYKASDDNEFGFNYSKRIDRPNYSQLNPAKSYSTRYNYQDGNPFLKPGIFNTAELSYTFKKQYTVSAFFNKLTDLASNVTVQDNVNKTFYDTQQNIGTIKEAGIELTTTSHPASWWEINNSAQVSYRTQKSAYLGGNYNYNNFMYYFSTTQSFTINKEAGLKAEATGWYNNGAQQGTLLVHHTYDVSAGLSKTVLNKQGTIRFSAADILYSNPYRLSVNYQGQNNGLNIKDDTRAFTVSFSYKLGKSIAAARKRSTAAEEERKRTN